MAMDLRIPIALIFILLGAILALYGLSAPNDIAPVDLGIRVNLLWGALMCVFGVGLGSLALFSRSRN
jgi:uncharacterized membrane protein YeiB